MFLAHATIGCLIAGVIMLSYMYDLGVKKVVKETAHYLAVPMVSLALVLSLGGLFGFHLYLILNNLSTLEID